MKVLVAFALLAVLCAAESLDESRPKVVPTIVERKPSFGLTKIVIVPKGDPRARPPTKNNKPNKPTTPATPATPAVPKLQSGQACTDNQGIKGTCMDKTKCSGKLTSGKCAGAANIMCCTQAPATPTPAPAAACEYAKGPTETVVGNKDIKYTAALIKREHLTDASNYGKSIVDADNRIVISTGLACAWEKLVAAAKAAGVTLTINSGFRSLSRQQYFYNCMISKKCNNGNLAAKPGTSNHGQGLALDLNTNCGSQGTAKAPLPKPPAACRNSKVYVWLVNNGPKFGFIRAVKNEPWHWEYHPGSALPSWATL